MPLADVTSGVERRERLVDGAVIAPVEDEHLGPRGDASREPDREPVRVRRGQRELPARDTEAACQLLAHGQRVLARQHQRDPACRLVGDRSNGRPGRMSRHRAGVPEAEVDVLEPVGVSEAGILRVDREDGEAAGPPHHPVHRDAAEQRSPRLLGQRARTRMVGVEARELRLEEVLDAHLQERSLRSELDRACPDAQLLREGVDDRGIELRARAALELVERLVGRE